MEERINKLIKEKEYIERGTVVAMLRAIVIRITPIEENRDMFYHDSGWNGASVAAKVEIGKIPTADVAPKSETAREILEEIEALATKHLALLEILNPQTSAVAAGGKHAFDLVLALITELKKKYTEEDDGT